MGTEKQNNELGGLTPFFGMKLDELARTAMNFGALAICAAVLLFPLLGNAQQPANTLNVTTDGTAAGDGVTDDAAAIQSAIHSAKALGKDVYFPAGTYLIGSNILTTNEVSLLGDHAGLSIITAPAGTARYVGNEEWSAPSGSIDVEDLVFVNVGADWYGSESTRKFIDVRRCLFIGEDPAFANPTSTDMMFQINVGHTVDSVVEDCLFLRQSSSMGASVYGYETVDQIYRRNVWGIHLDRTDWLATEWSGYSAWSSLLTKLQTLRTQFGLSADQGHFQRGIKINGCTGSLVEHNIFNGSPYTSTTPVNRDHVIYAHGGYSDLEVLSNWMRGWPSAPNGGLKLRNTHGTTTVIANRFINTPILQYAYSNNVPQTYENAIVHRNRMEIYQNFSDGRLGISFWETVDGVPSQTNNEYSANTFECPTSYASCINLTNGDLDGHTAYDSNVYLSDGTPVTTAHNTGSFPLESGGPDSSRTSAYDSYQIPDLNIPTYTSDPEFSTSLVNLGTVFSGQAVTGSVSSLASDADGESLEFMKMDGPDWLAVNLDGTFSGTPAPTNAGVNDFTIRAADNKDGCGDTTLRVTVDANYSIVICNPVHDTYVYHGAVSNNYGTNTALLVRSDKYDTAYNAFLMFDVNAETSTVVSASLKLYCTLNPIITTVHEVSDTSWDESTMTWENQPVMDAGIESRSTGTNVWETFDVTASVVSSGRVAFALTSSEASYSKVDSKEGANPPVLEIVVAADPADWDGDGLPNAWELDYFGGNTNAIATAHGDDDGQDNWSEYIAGTDPVDGGSFFSASSMNGADGFIVSWAAQEGRVCDVYRSTDLISGFSCVASNVAYPVSNYTSAAGSNADVEFIKIQMKLDQ